MAAILIVEDDGVVARRMAGALRRAGHIPVLAPNGRSAMREAIARPAVILLDLGLPDVPGETVLQQLRRLPETSEPPVLVITGQKERATRLIENRPDGIAHILVKPVSDAVLSRAEGNTLPSRKRSAPAPGAGSDHDFQRRELIGHLIVKGSDRIASQVYRRMVADRRPGDSVSNDLPTWTQIVQAAKLEGLLTEEQGPLLVAPAPRSEWNRNDGHSRARVTEMKRFRHQCYSGP